jgi:hypothetical protein
MPFTAAPVLFFELLALLEELQAASRAEAAADALTSPVPVSSRRRVGPSFIFRVSIASSTLGSISLITILHFLGAG